MKRILLVLISILFIINPLFAGGNRWTNKPPIGSYIDWSHPLSKGLVGCWLMNEGGGGRSIDLLGTNNGVFVSTTSWSRGKLGIATKYNGSSDYISVSTTKILSGKTQFSLIAWVNTLGALSVAGGRPIYAERASSGQDIVKLEALPLTGVGANSGLITYRNDGGTLTQSGGTTDMQIIKDFLLCGVRDLSGLKFYMDGKLVDSDARVGNDDLTNSVASRIGNDIGGGIDAYWSGLIYFVYIYNRALSPSEIQQLYQDPYCFIKSPTVWSMFSTAVAAARRFFMFD